MLWILMKHLDGRVVVVAEGAVETLTEHSVKSLCKQEGFHMVTQVDADSWRDAVDTMSL